MLKTPLKPIQRNKGNVIAFFVLVILSYIAGHLASESEVELPKITRHLLDAATGVMLVLFMICWLRDPGYIEKDEQIDFFQLLEAFDPNSLCPECEVIRTPRSRHCTICDKCVLRFDHHCPWINNCVGAGNHAWFLVFILVATASSALSLYIRVSTLSHIFDHRLDLARQVIEKLSLPYSTAIAVYLGMGSVAFFFTTSLL
jgi:palmitoyltransferase